MNHPQFDTTSDMYDYLHDTTQEGGAGEFVLRNFVGVIRDISVEASTVQTELFPKGALDYYTKKNMGWDYTKEEYGQWRLPERGGEQGDYREGVSAMMVMMMMMLRGGQPIVFHIPVASPHTISTTLSCISIIATLHPLRLFSLFFTHPLQMQAKIANVIDCLKTEPLSKRAIIPIPFATTPSATVDWTNQGQTKCCRELHFYVEDGKLKCTGLVRMQNANIFVKNIHFFATLIGHVAEALGGIEVGEYTHFITNVCFDRNATSC